MFSSGIELATLRFLAGRLVRLTIGAVDFIYICVLNCSKTRDNTMYKIHEVYM